MSRKRETCSVNSNSHEINRKSKIENRKFTPSTQKKNPPSFSDRLKNCFESLLDSYGPQHWWPGETRCEIMIGAVLTQNTAWSNVERAIANLKSRRLLDWNRILAISGQELALLIRPSGYYNQKTLRVKSLAEWAIGNQNIDPGGAGTAQIDSVRNSLLSLNGIGPETADSILLYGYGLPLFVVDAYTRRFISRHGMASNNAPYESIREFFEVSLPRDAAVYNEYHALIVRVGKQHCRKKNPECIGCPLEYDLKNR